MNIYQHPTCARNGAGHQGHTGSETYTSLTLKEVVGALDFSADMKRAEVWVGGVGGGEGGGAPEQRSSPLNTRLLRLLSAVQHKAPVVPSLVRELDPTCRN